MAQLTEAECEQVLRRNGIGRLASYSPAMGECYVVPVAYTYEPGALYFQLVPGQKLNYLDEHPAGVCFEVEEVHRGEDWTTVVVTGTFARVDQTAAASRGHRGDLRTIFDIGFTPFQPRELVVCRLDISRMSGQHDRWSWRTDAEKDGVST